MTHPSRNRWSTLVAFLELRFRFIAILVIVTGVVMARDAIEARIERWFDPAHVVPLASAPSAEWYCPMDEAVVRDEPASCPLCGMPLSRRTLGVDEPLPSGVLSRVALSPRQIALAGIRTVAIGYRTLLRETRFIGEITVDPRRRITVASKVRGRIERVCVATVGTEVQCGDQLLALYSPDLVNAQQVYLQLLESRTNLHNGAGAPGELPMTQRERPLQLGLALQDLEELERTHEVKLEMPVRAPCSGTIAAVGPRVGQYVDEGTELYEITDLTVLALEVRVPNQEIDRVRIGQELTFQLRDRNATVLTRIESIEPFANSVDRTHLVRGLLANDDRALVPGTLVDVVLREPASGQAAPAGTADADAVLAVPFSSVLESGRGAIVYREVRSGVYEAVGVRLGARAGDAFPILSGLVAGDRVVAAGAFLLEAESTWIDPAPVGVSESADRNDAGR